MFVIFISECNKKALIKTREILDQFATRKGRRTWFTNINEEGLNKIKTLLTQSASKNTCVMCYTHYASSSKMLFSVGASSNISDYNAIPTNKSKKIMDFTSNNFFIYQAIAVLARLSGLFHDFGKSYPKFQEKLLTNNRDDIVRHEFLSCLFLYKIAKKCNDDIEFIHALKNIDANKNIIFTAEELKQNIIIYSLKSKLAQSICYLTLSHHVMPTPTSYTKIEEVDKHKEDIFKHFLCDGGFDFSNTKYTLKNTNENNDISDIIFDNHLYKSAVFIKCLNNCLHKIEKLYPSINKYFGLENILILHMSRLSLILADHFYSSSDAKNIYHDTKYTCIANTVTNTHNPRQYLDDHVCTIASYAYFFAKSLKTLKQDLPSINNSRALRKQSKERFAWQNEVYNKCLQHDVSKSGFFGVNLASTGQGKTFTNAKIMYALSKEKNLRFNYATTLRTLTLQTGRALKEKLATTNDIAVKIGSKILYDLKDYLNDYKNNDTNIFFGSSKLDEDNNFTIDETKHTTNNNMLKILKKFLGDKYNNILAPTFVSTLDYIIEASEGFIGGRHCFAFLRLLSSDLVIDEIDDIDCEHQVAIIYLVYFAGMLGTKVLISSASINSVFITHLFDAYNNGRKLYNATFYPNIEDNKINVGIFTENISILQKINDFSEFKTIFTEQLTQHFNIVEQQQTYQIHKVVEIEKSDNIIESFAQRINLSIEELHKEHFTEYNNVKVSTGLVRIAYIHDIVKIARNLLKISPSHSSTKFHYIIYHSNYTVEKRAKIEYRLDELLSRKCSTKEFFNKELISTTINENPSIKHHVFIVIASPIAEIGRDHDYDFAIIEPSSYRSIVQIAGRVQRHRHMSITVANIHIINQNIKSVTNNTECPYSKPGFEHKKTYCNTSLQLHNKNIKPSFDKYIYKLTAKNSVIIHTESSASAPNLWSLEFFTSLYFLNATKILLKDQFVSLVGHIPLEHKLRKYNQNTTGTISFTDTRVQFEYLLKSKALKPKYFEISNEHIEIANNVALIDIENIHAFDKYKDCDRLNTIDLDISEDNFIYSNVFGFYINK